MPETFALNVFVAFRKGCSLAELSEPILYENHDVIELPLLLPREQAEVLLERARDEGLSLGQLLRDLIERGWSEKNGRDDGRDPD